MPAPRATICIVDDEAPVRTALERLLRSAGYAGRTFESVDDFIAADLEVKPACVVADIRMPGISGLELPARLRAQHKDIPVIFITAYDTPDTRAEARRAGAAGYFRKPVDDQALLDAIEWAIEHPISTRTETSKPQD